MTSPECAFSERCCVTVVVYSGCCDAAVMCSERCHVPVSQMCSGCRDVVPCRSEFYYVIALMYRCCQVTASAVQWMELRHGSSRAWRRRSVNQANQCPQAACTFHAVAPRVPGCTMDNKTEEPRDQTSWTSKSSVSSSLALFSFFLSFFLYQLAEASLDYRANV